MDAERWRRIEAEFHALAGAPAHERAARLEALDDATLRDEVARLLAQDDALGGGADDPAQDALSGAAARVVADGAQRLVGRRYGAWRLEAPIAQGGMGAVYRAVRDDGAFEQQAAIKLVNRALLSEATLQRFHDERQILARLAHPRIARLLDGGSTPEGEPWLAMEFVDGLPIDEHCRRHALPLRARLELFIKVCEAVSHAHRSLVVHRDIKPSNILVDDAGEPRLLDFGVARLLDTDGDADATLTRADQRALTPRYASPEQLAGLPLTTATDVYSLAVLLYELLAGGDPYRLDTAGARPMPQAVTDTEAERPSTAARRRAATAGAEATPVPPQALRGDLDNILLTGLRKEPARRYASVQAFADDVRRHLAHQPVLARPDTLGYRVGKFVRRHRVGTAVAAVATLAVAAQAGFLVQRIVAERDAARAAQLQAEETVDFLQALLRGADRYASRGREVTVRDVLDRGAARIERELSGQPLVQARLTETMATSYQGISRYDTALALAQRAHAQFGEVAGPDDPQTLRAMRLVGKLMSQAGDPPGAIAWLERTRDAQRAALGPDAPMLVETLFDLGVVHLRLSHQAEALQSLRPALAMTDRLPPGSPGRRLRARLLNQIGWAQDLDGQRDAALASYRESLAELQSSGSPDDPEIGVALHNIGTTMARLSRFDEALDHLDRAQAFSLRVLGEDNEDFEVQLSALGRVEAQAGRYADAERHLTHALAIQERLYGDDHPNTAYGLGNLARLYQIQGRHAEVLPRLERAIAIYRRAYGPDNGPLNTAEIGLAQSLVGLGRMRDADRLLRGLRTRVEADANREPWVLPQLDSVQGEVWSALGDEARGRGALTAGHDALLEALGPRHPLTRAAAGRLAADLERHGDAEGARRLRAEADAG